MVSQWAMSRTSYDHLCGLGWSCRSLGISFTVCEWSIRGRNLEDSARGSREVRAPDGRTTLAWAALLGGGGRLFRSRNGERSTESKPRFFSDILWLEGNLHTVKKDFYSFICCCLPSNPLRQEDLLKVY
jgi:hypothetical protein